MRASPATPRWVKAAFMIVLVLAVLAAVLLVVGGPHTPGRHASPDDASPAALPDRGER